MTFSRTCFHVFFFSIQSSDMGCKYILVTGGVISGIGKGVIASSTGLLLKSMGLRVTAVKIDPYLNIDAGTLTPLDHGTYSVLEVLVLVC